MSNTFTDSALNGDTGCVTVVFISFDVFRIIVEYGWEKMVKLDL